MNLNEFELWEGKPRKQRGLYSSMYSSGVLNIGGGMWMEWGKPEKVTLSYNKSTGQILIRKTTNEDKAARTVNYDTQTNALIPSAFNFARHHQIVPERPRYYNHEFVILKSTENLGNGTLFKDEKALLLTPLEPTAEYWPNRRGVDNIQMDNGDSIKDGLVRSMAEGYISDMDNDLPNQVDCNSSLTESKQLKWEKYKKERDERVKHYLREKQDTSESFSHIIHVDKTGTVDYQQWEEYKKQRDERAKQLKEDHDRFLYLEKQRNTEREQGVRERRNRGEP